jgi:hypothetical protein
MISSFLRDAPRGNTDRSLSNCVALPFRTCTAVCEPVRDGRTGAKSIELGECRRRRARAGEGKAEKDFSGVSCAGTPEHYRFLICVCGTFAVVLLPRLQESLTRDKRSRPGK